VVLDAESMHGMIPVVAFIGPSKSGKTTLIEKVVSHLSSKGLAVGTIKHIRNGDFSIDVSGKDTWRHAEAGASVVVGAAARQVVILKKRISPYQSVEELLDMVGNEELDVIIIEGFRSLTASKHDIFKVILAKTKDDLGEGLKDVVEPIIAVVGPNVLRVAVPDEKAESFFDIDTEKEKAVMLIAGIVTNARKRKNLQA